MNYRAQLAVLFFAFLLFAGACSDGDDAADAPTPAAHMTFAEAAAPGAFAVGVTTLSMVDESRETEANRDFPGSRHREMEVEIWYPAATTSPEERDEPAAAGGGPFPLIIFAHGYSSVRTQSASYAQHLASHGYVVVAPGFPSTRLDSPGGPRLYGVLDQPADVSFVIDELLRLNVDAGFMLTGTIDPERIGMTGHSGGGLTTMITAYGPLRESRIDAVVPIAPVGCLVPADIAGQDVVPAMIVGGSDDLLVGPPSIYLAYEAASAPKYFVEIMGGDHVRFGDFDATDADLGDVLNQTSRGDITADAIRTAQGTGADPTACLDRTPKGDEAISAERQRELLRGAALPFFDYYLKDDAAAKAFLDETLPAQAGIRFENREVRE